MDSFREVESKILIERFVGFVTEKYNPTTEKYFKGHYLTGVFINTKRGLEHFIQRILEREVPCERVATMLMKFTRKHICEFLYLLHSSEDVRTLELIYENTHIIMGVNKYEDKVLLNPITVIVDRTTDFREGTIVMEVLGK